MISASEPQEYVPCGRQKLSTHPGLLDPLEKHKEIDDLLLNSLEKVSLSGHNDTEWWIIRTAPSDIEKPEETTEQNVNNPNKSFIPFPNKLHNTHFNDSMDYSHDKSDVNISKFGKRVSDANVKYPNKRLSVESEHSKLQKSCSVKPKSGSTIGELSSKVDPGFMEEELYVKGNTAVWSRGLLNNTDNLDNGRKTICCYTIPMPIQQALWCTFYCERPTYDQCIHDVMSKIDEPSGTVVEAICLVDTHNVRVFTVKGEQFVIAIPFRISKVWTTKFGIFIEKEEDGNFRENLCEPMATLYSLAYPLDDVCPALISQSSGVGIYTNPNLKIIFTSIEPSICVAYDSVSKTHSVFKIRKVKPDERDHEEKGHTTRHSVNSNPKLKNRLSVFDNLLSNTHMVTPSPISNKGTTLANMCHLQKSKSYTSMATMSRCQTPSSVGSPWPQSFASSNILKNQQANQTKSFFDCSKSMSLLRSTATICLEYLWSESSPTQDSNSIGPASKVFLTKDLVGQGYLCYILPLKFQLSIVKVDYSTPNITFGVATSISAKDAVGIPHLNMLAILEHSGNVTLYSGLTIVGKLHVGGMLAQHVPSPFIRRNMPCFNSPFPRRSSLLPQATASEPKFDEHLLSPVLPAGIPHRTPGTLELDRGDRKATLAGLVDAAANRLTLKYSDGTFYRITLPILATSVLVENCLTVLERCLPRDTGLSLLARWYATRNVIGADGMKSEQEWGMFLGLVYELLGYEDEQIEGDLPEVSSKKHKLSESGSSEDWEYLLGSDHKNVADDLSRFLKIDFCKKTEEEVTKKSVIVNPKSVLFPYIRQIHFLLHLLYEDFKVNTLRTGDLVPLMKMLNKLSSDLNLSEYCVYYWKDFPKIATLASDVRIPENYLKLVNTWNGMSDTPVSIMEHIYNLLQVKYLVQPYPFLDKVNNRSRDIVQICGALSYANTNNQMEVQLDSFIQDYSQHFLHDNQTQKSATIDSSTIEKVVLLMVQMKINTRYLETLPMGIYFLFYNAMWKCREKPPADWPVEAYNLVYRDDLVAQVHNVEMIKERVFLEKMTISNQLQEPAPPPKQEVLDIDGMEDIDSNLTKMIFCEDMRIAETRKMLASAKPVPIVLTQRPDVSDHDFIEEQEKHLYSLCIRTMAVPVGRGMFTLRTTTPIITEPLTAPPLCLTGKAPPRGATVDLNHIDTPANMNLWPLFHNGVANGLRVTPDAQNIDNTWIIFNKPKSGVEPHMEHAGFLMALGLNGHLKNLAILSTFDYLWKLHEMTSVGVLLGLSAAFRGTSHQSLTKILAIHVEALLPPTSMELDVPQNLQVAGLLGLGLVYQRTAHRHITEVLLAEIGRPPGPEMENSVDRESYSLAAGLALGLVTLKHGGKPTGLSDLNVPDTLHYYMVGGNKRPLVGSQKDKYKTPSFQIREGHSVNLDVTAPGATLALGLMYLGTGNKAIADWMSPPETQYLLDFVRPDFLMLRILSKSLIMWNDVEPSKEWVEANVPSTIRPYCMVKPTLSNDIDYEAMNQAYCNIVAGSCFAMGLKFAGTADKNAFETLLFFCHMFTSLTGKSIADLAGKATIETCLNVVLISASMVMAGTGNLEIMRLVRHLRRRVGIPNSAIVTYGSHLAVHMALGLLYLGGGRYTLSNSPASVAALICAFYPKFPTHSNDNRYHLQAFRHLYVLAVEPRLLIPRDVANNELCYANLSVAKLGGLKASDGKIRVPGLIPDLNTLTRVTVDDERYWPVVFERGRNWDLLMKSLTTTGYIQVKQRAGCLSYVVDKFGYHSQLARTLTQSTIVPWDPSPSNIASFTSDEYVRNFCDHFLGTNREKANYYENRFTQMLTKVAYEAVIKDKLIIIIVMINLIKAVFDLNTHPNTTHLWQLKLISMQVLNKSFSNNIISKEAILALQQEITGVLDKWEDNLKVHLRKYLMGEDFNAENNAREMLANYCVYYDLPYKICMGKMEKLEMLVRLKGLDLSLDAIRKVVRIFE